MGGRCTGVELRPKARREKSLRFDESFSQVLSRDAVTKNMIEITAAALIALGIAATYTALAAAGANITPRELEMLKTV